MSASAGGHPSTGGARGTAGKASGVGDNTKPGAAPPAGSGKDAPSGPAVEVTDLLVDSPGVDFTGPGRYDVTVSALLKEHCAPGVWDVVAFGEDGKRVGTQEIFLALSEFKPKMLMFNDFYCESIPVKIAITWTDKKGDRGDTTKEKESGGTDSGGKAPGGTGTGGASGGTPKPGAA
jgi:hypothetical protein